MKLTFEKDIDDVYRVDFWECGVMCMKSWLLRMRGHVVYRSLWSWPLRKTLTMSTELTFENEESSVWRVDFWAWCLWSWLLRKISTMSIELTFENEESCVWRVDFWEWGVTLFIGVYEVDLWERHWRCLRSWLLRMRSQVSEELTFESDVYEVDFWERYRRCL